LPLLRIDLAERSQAGAAEIAKHAGPFAIVHYQARSYWQRKDLDHATVDRLVDALIRRGMHVFLIDVDRRSPLARRSGLIKVLQHEVDWNGEISHSDLGSDPTAPASLAALSEINVGIDSGPGHLFGCVPAKAVICWRGLHPLHNYGPTNNVLHVVPSDHERHIYGDDLVGAAFFRQHYRHLVYHRQGDLVDVVCCELERPWRRACKSSTSQTRQR
jgi:hypothetical protein